MDSLRNRIVRQRDPDDGGYRLNDPGVLMNYASTNENMSPLTGDAYLKYGVPRVRGEGAEVINAILTTLYTVTFSARLDFKCRTLS